MFRVYPSGITVADEATVRYVSRLVKQTIRDMRWGTSIETQEPFFLMLRGFLSWPPVWTRESGPETFPSGEVAVLDHVQGLYWKTGVIWLFSTMARRYVGVLQCENREPF